MDNIRKLFYGALELLGPLEQQYICHNEGEAYEKKNPHSSMEVGESFCGGVLLLLDLNLQCVTGSHGFTEVSGKFGDTLSA